MSSSGRLSEKWARAASSASAAVKARPLLRAPRAPQARQQRPSALQPRAQPRQGQLLGRRLSALCLAGRGVFANTSHLLP